MDGLYGTVKAGIGGVGVLPCRSPSSNNPMSGPFEPRNVMKILKAPASCVVCRLSPRRQSADFR